MTQGPEQVSDLGPVPHTHADGDDMREQGALCPEAFAATRGPAQVDELIRIGLEQSAIRRFRELFNGI